jgi:hypothetical protein
MKGNYKPVLGCLIVVVFVVAFVVIGTRAVLWYDSRAEKRELTKFAELVGDIRIEPEGMTWKDINSLLPGKPVLKPAEQVMYLIEFHFGPRTGLIGGEFYAREPGQVQNDSRPISMWVRLPFKGRFCGVRLGMAREEAMSIIRKIYPYAHFKENEFIFEKADWTIEFGGEWKLVQYRNKEEGTCSLILKKAGYVTVPVT